MAGPDLSLITNAPNLTDKIMQDQAYNAQLQAQQIDLRQKQNAYAAQVMSAAAGSGDPAQYARGRQLLASQGIDVSNWSEDPAVGFEQAKAARTALMTPQGVMNAQIQMQRNQIQAAGPNGTMAPTTMPDLYGDNPFRRTVDPSPATPVPAPSPTTPIPSSGSAASGFASLPVVASGATTNLPQSGSAQAPSPSSPPSLSATIQAPQSSLRLPSPDDPQYAGYNPEMRIKLSSADAQRIKDSPEYKKAIEAAASAGKVAGELPEKAVASQQGIDQVANNIEGMKALIPHLPEQGLILSAQSQAAISNRLGANQNPDETTRNTLNSLFGDNQAKSNAYNQFNLINEAQTINAIKELAATGQIRMTKQLTSIIQQGFLVDPNASNTAKMNQANAVLAELKNAAINPQNVNATLNGGQQQPYVPVPTGIVNGSTATPQLGEDPITAELRKRGAIK